MFLQFICFGFNLNFDGKKTWFYSFLQLLWKKKHFVALDKISLEIFALFSCLFLFWCCCVFWGFFVMYPLLPLFTRHHSSFGPSALKCTDAKVKHFRRRPAHCPNIQSLQLFVFFKSYIHSDLQEMFSFWTGTNKNVI